MPAQKDTILGGLAVQRGYLTREQVDEAFEIQRKMHDELGMDQPLEQVLVAKHWLTPDQAHELRNAAAVQTGEARLVAGYEAISKLGQGGMGAVYKARRVGTEEFVALKVLPPSLADEERIARFRRESAIVRELDHENIVACVEFGFDKRRKVHFCALELVEGEDLAKRITRLGRLTEDEALSITSQMAMALQHAFFNGLVHRDVKPENVMVTADGTAKLLDLGLARQASREATRLTESGMFVGSPYYASPEQALGQKDVDTRSDIYSLGATLYHMVTGKPPFEGTTALAILQKHVAEKLPWPAEVNPELSDGLCTVIAKMMSKNPDDRYQTPNELNQDLDLLMEGEAPEVAEAVLRRSSLALPAIRPRRSRRQASRPRVARDRDRKRRRPGERARAEARPERKKRESARAHRKPPEHGKPPERHEGPSAGREALRKLSVHAMRAVRAARPVWERLPRQARIAIPIVAALLAAILLAALIFGGGEPDRPPPEPVRSEEGGDISRAEHDELAREDAAARAGPPAVEARKVPPPSPGKTQRKPEPAAPSVTGADRAPSPKPGRRTAADALSAAEAYELANPKDIAGALVLHEAIGAEFPGTPQAAEGQMNVIRLVSVLKTAGDDEQAAAEPPEPWPGVWAELEGGKRRGGEITESEQASGGKYIGGFHSVGNRATVDLDIDEDVRDAHLLVRLARWGTDNGALSISVKGESTKFSGGTNTRHGPGGFHWEWIPIGDLRRGRYAAGFSCPVMRSGGALDLVGIVPGDVKGKWAPPNKAVGGRLPGFGPAVVVTPTSGLMTTEPGGTATFRVRLGSRPSARVAVAVKCSDRGEGVADKPRLVFSRTDWRERQTVTVAGRDDKLKDMHVAYKMALSVSTTCPAYRGIPAPEVSVWNLDDEFDLRIPPDAVEFGGHWYKLFRDRKTWHEARRFCEEQGGYLVAITSREEDVFVAKLARAAGRSVWIGFTDEREEGTWEWVTGERVAFARWAEGEPKNLAGRQHHARLWPEMDFAWGDEAARGLSSKHPLALVCEWEPGRTRRASAAPAKALTLDLGGGVKMAMVYIKPGVFMMGSQNGEANEKPVHEVAITKGFYIGKYEVTQAQYEAVTGKNPSKWQGPNRPVERVMWHQAAEFCRLATERTRRQFRLPTEAEWEFACRAGSTGRYCFGSDEGELGDYAWYKSNSGGQSRPVGQKKPNAWGLYDMHGNLWEFVADWYDAGYYANSPLQDPTGPDAGELHLRRGGSWFHGGEHCRSAIRHKGPPSRRYDSLGFRVVVSAPTSAPSAKPVRAIDLTRGLVGHWKFDEGQGSVAHDSSLKRNHGEITGARWAKGRIGRALEFDGRDDHVVIPRVVQDDFTIAFWLKTEQRKGGRGGNWFTGAGLVDADVKGHSKKDFGTSLVGNRFAFGSVKHGSTIASKTKVNDATWHHVAATREREAGSMKVWVDGVLEAARTGSTESLDAPRRITIGCQQTDIGYFRGLIDDVRIYDRALSAEEVTLLAHPEDAARPAPARAAVDKPREKPAGKQIAKPAERPSAKPPAPPAPPGWPPDTAALRRVFRGEIRRWIPKKLEIELYYDFRSSRQAEDWSLRPEGEAQADVMKIHGGVLRLLPSKRYALLKGVFTSVSTLVKFGVVRGGKGNVALVACSDGKGSFYEFFGLQAWRSSYLDKAAGRRPTRLSAVKGSPLAAVKRTGRAARLPWRGAMTLNFADGHLRGRIGGLVLEADDRSFPQGHVGVRAADTEVAFESFFVSGVLDRAWLEGALGISGDPPPAAKVQSSTRRAAKAAGQASSRSAAPAQVSPGVPRDAVEFGGHRYKVYAEKRNWPDAKRFCEEQGGHLVTITSKEENDIVVALVRKHGAPAWIGFSDERTEGRWEWVTGEDARFLAWDRNQPDDHGGAEDAAVACRQGTSGWNDSHVSSGMFFVCEWEPGGPGAPGRKTLTLDLGGGVTIEMVHIKPGVFMMGSNEVPKRDKRGVHKPVHEVAITRGFYMAKHKVTQAQFEAVTGANPSQRKDPKSPVETVTWYDGAKFCRIVTQKTGRQFRLPTEAEWEYACRAGTKVVADPKARGRPAAVEGPNAWGLHDMYADRWEWVADWYGEDYYAKSPREDPTGPAKGSFRVLRGRWYVGADSVLHSRRAGGYAPAFRQNYVGFRVAASAHTLVSSTKFLRGLVGHWKFDEGSGTVAYDSSGRGNEGTVKGAKWAKGVMGGALEFDGSDDVIQIGAPDLDAPWSAAMWVKRKAGPKRVTTLMNSKRFSLRLKQIGTERKLGFTRYGVKDYVFDAEAPVGVWCHIVFVGTAAGTSVYVDGVKRASDPATIGMPMSGFGRGADHSPRALIDDVRIYGRALSADEIKDLAAAR